MDAGVEVCLVHLPGREGRLREPSLTSVAAIAGGVAKQILPFLDVPYVFFGHSLGGTIAFETARLLRGAGRMPPEMLIVSASRAPHLPWPYPPVRHLTDLELLREIHSRYDSVPAEIMESADLRELLVPPLRADIGALETYSYAKSDPFAFGIRVFGGRADTMVSESALEAWREHTSASFGRKLFDGGHLYMQTARRDVMGAVSAELRSLDLIEPALANPDILRRPVPMPFPNKES